jgi:hypothetical protein
MSAFNSNSNSGVESEDDFEHVNLTHSDSASRASDVMSPDGGDFAFSSPGSSIASPIQIDDGEEADEDNEGRESDEESEDMEASSSQSDSDEDGGREPDALADTSAPDQDIGYIERAKNRLDRPDPSDPGDDDDDDGGDDNDDSDDDDAVPADPDDPVSDSDEEDSHDHRLWQHQDCLLYCQPFWERTNAKKMNRKRALRQAVRVIHACKERKRIDDATIRRLKKQIKDLQKPKEPKGHHELVCVKARIDVASS